MPEDPRVMSRGRGGGGEGTVVVVVDSRQN